MKLQTIIDIIYQMNENLCRFSFEFFVGFLQKDDLLVLSYIESMYLGNFLHSVTLYGNVSLFEQNKNCAKSMIEEFLLFEPLIVVFGPCWFQQVGKDNRM